jgi:hypothetical protein
MFGAVTVFQSCEEMDIISFELAGSGETENFVTSSGISEPKSFTGINEGFPKNYSNGEEKLELWTGPVNDNSAMKIGYIEFFQSSTPENIIVRFNFQSPDNSTGLPEPAIKNIYFHISDLFSEIPLKERGNPDTERFQYIHKFSPDFKGPYFEFEYTLPPDANNDGYYVAANADIYFYGGTEGFSFYLPDNLTEYEIFRNAPYSTYNIHFRYNSAGFLTDISDGIFTGWSTRPGVDYPDSENQYAYVFSVYETIPSFLSESEAIASPENLDLINWIVNNYPNGSNVNQYKYNTNSESEKSRYNINDFSTVGNTGIITSDDIQCAIWTLLNYENESEYLNSLPNLNLSNVWGIIRAALTSGNADGYTPDCNSKLLALLVPFEENLPQTDKTILLEVNPEIYNKSIPCKTSCKKVWADGKLGANFPSTSQWSTYFRWNINTF